MTDEMKKALPDTQVEVLKTLQEMNAKREKELVDMKKTLQDQIEDMKKSLQETLSTELKKMMEKIEYVSKTVQTIAQKNDSDWTKRSVPASPSLGESRVRDEKEDRLGMLASETDDERSLTPGNEVSGNGSLMETEEISCEDTEEIKEEVKISLQGFKSGSLGYMAITQLGIDSIKCPFGCLNRRGGVNAWSKRGFDGHCAHSHPNEVVIPVEYMKHQVHKLILKRKREKEAQEGTEWATQSQPEYGWRIPEEVERREDDNN